MAILDEMETGLKIKKLMTDTGTKPKDIQNLLGFASTYPVYKWMNGQNMPTLDNLVTLADYFGIGLDDIVVKKAV